MATYAIGDLQGCFQSLMTLLTQIDFDPANDRLWLTGDLVNRGPQSLACLRYIQSLGDKAITVLGNHDLHLLAIYHGAQRTQTSDTLDAVLAAPDIDALCAWLIRQPLLHYDPALRFLLVHAGIYPTWDLQQAQSYADYLSTKMQRTAPKQFFTDLYGNAPCAFNSSITGKQKDRILLNIFTRMRFLDEHLTLQLNYKGTVADCPAGLYPWFSFPSQQSREFKIIFGHWSALAGDNLGYPVYPLDTGCVWGRMLTALRLEDQQLFSVPTSEKNHYV